MPKLDAPGAGGLEEIPEDLDRLNRLGDSVAFFLDLPFLPATHQDRNTTLFFKLSNPADAIGLVGQNRGEKRRILDEDGNDAWEEDDPQEPAIDRNEVERLLGKWGELNKEIKSVDVNEIIDAVWLYANAVRGRESLTEEDVTNALELQKMLEGYMPAQQVHEKIVYVEKSKIVGQIRTAHASLEALLAPVMRKLYRSEEMKRAMRDGDYEAVVDELARNGLSRTAAQDLHDAYTMAVDFNETYSDGYGPGHVEDSWDDPEVLLKDLQNAGAVVKNVLPRLGIAQWGGLKSYWKRHNQ